MLRSISNTPVMSPLQGSSFNFSKFLSKPLISKSKAKKPQFGSHKDIKFPKVWIPNFGISKTFGTKKFGGKNDWDFDGVPNKIDCRPRDMTRTTTLRKVVSQRSGQGKGFDQYQTPEGINVVFDLTKKTKRDKYPSLDEVGYVLDNLPKDTIPKGTTIRFSPRVFDRTWIDSSGDERTKKINVPLKIGVMAFEDISDDAEHTVRVYTRPTLFQLDRVSIVKKYGKRAADRAMVGYTESEGFKEADKKRKQEEFAWGRKVLIHEIGHNIDFDRGLKDKYEKDESLKYKEAPTRYGKKNPREDIAESFVLWSQGELGEKPKTGEESKSGKIRNIKIGTEDFIPDAEIKRKEFFEEHLADIDRTKIPSVREDAESLVTPYSLIHETDKDLSDEGYLEWGKRHQLLKYGAEQAKKREEDKQRELIETLTPEQRREIIEDMQKEFSQEDVLDNEVSKDATESGDAESGDSEDIRD